MGIARDKAWDTAMLRFGDELNQIVDRYANADLLELGAGRRPSFAFSDLPGNIETYTVNDVCEDELALLPQGYAKACFDVSGDASAFADTYDVVFSRFLAEHVPDGEAMHRNVYDVLREGGTAFHLIPTLYALPFVVNKYLPAGVTERMLKLFSPRRAISPKFPAPYSACYSDPGRMTAMLRAIGYRHVEIRTFYGHFYYEKIPVLKELHEKFSQIAAERNWHVFGTYAYIKAGK